MSTTATGHDLARRGVKWAHPACPSAIALSALLASFGAGLVVPPLAGSILVFDTDPFVNQDAAMIAAFDAPDWTSDPGPVPGPVTATVESWDPARGWSAPRRVDFAIAVPAGARVWVNQLASDIAFFRFGGRPAPGFVDADGNGLPDAWELRYFGRTGIDPNADADRDGVSNGDEYLAGTHPAEAPDQPLEIEVALAPAEVAGGAPILRFAIPVGTPEAQLEAVDRLGGIWEIAPAALREEGGQRVLELPLDPVRPAQFFRWRKRAP